MRGWWGRPLCSQNAHIQKVLVRCAQLRSTPPSPQGVPNPFFRGRRREVKRRES